MGLEMTVRSVDRPISASSSAGREAGLLPNFLLHLTLRKCATRWFVVLRHAFVVLATYHLGGTFSKMMRSRRSGFVPI